MVVTNENNDAPTFWGGSFVCVIVCVSAWVAVLLCACCESSTTICATDRGVHTGQRERERVKYQKGVALALAGCFMCERESMLYKLLCLRFTTHFQIKTNREIGGEVWAAAAATDNNNNNNLQHQHRHTDSAMAACICHQHTHAQVFAIIHHPTSQPQHRAALIGCSRSHVNTSAHIKPDGRRALRYPFRSIHAFSAFRAFRSCLYANSIRKPTSWIVKK